MELLFKACAIFGSIILILQTLMNFFGLDAEAEDIADIGDDLEMGDEYLDTHAVSTYFFGILSFRSVIAGIAFFGIGGLIGVSAGFPPIISIWFGIGMGLPAMILVGLLMQVMYKLKSDGSLNMNNAIGSQGTVYLGIPENNTGIGKVTISIQNRTLELNAVTMEEEAITTGTLIEVCELIDQNTVQVKRK